MFLLLRNISYLMHYFRVIILIESRKGIARENIPVVEACVNLHHTIMNLSYVYYLLAHNSLFTYKCVVCHIKLYNLKRVKLHYQKVIFRRLFPMPLPKLTALRCQRYSITKQEFLIKVNTAFK